MSQFEAAAQSIAELKKPKFQHNGQITVRVTVTVRVRLG